MRGAGAESGSRSAKVKRNKQASLVLRVANPQETSVRVRLAHDPDITTSSQTLSSGDGVEGGLDGSGYVSIHEDDLSGGLESAANVEQERTGWIASALRASGAAGLREKEDDKGAYVGMRRRVVSVTVRPDPPQGCKDAWVTLEGKEDELLRAPSEVLGSRHRLPESALDLLAAVAPDATENDSIAAQTVGAGAAIAGEEGKGNEETGEDSVSARTSQAAVVTGKPFVLHQQGDVAWVQLPLDRLAATRVAAAAKAAEAEGRGGGGAPGSVSVVVVTVRFLLTMGDVDEGVAGGAREVQVPIAVRFSLSECPP